MDTCSWDNPGHNPYMGSIAAAVARYDIPEDARQEIILKAARVQYDDVADITKGGIYSRTNSYSELRDMHFGTSYCKGKVTIDNWKYDHIERALIYCSQGYCIAVPFVCRNVSLVTPKGLTNPSEHRDPIPKVPEDKVNTVPEPPTILLLMAALVGIILLKRKNNGHC